MSEKKETNRKRAKHAYPPLKTLHLKAIWLLLPAPDAQLYLQSPSRMDRLRRAGYSDIAALRKSKKEYSPALADAIMQLGEEVVLTFVHEIYEYAQEAGEILTPAQIAIKEAIEDSGKLESYQNRVQEAKEAEGKPKQRGRPRKTNVVIPS